MASVYEQLGGAPAIQAAGELFYRKVLSDPELAPFFESVDMEAQVRKQVAFLTMVTGGPNQYTGRDLRSAHAKVVEQGAGDLHFDRVIQHLGDTLKELGVGPELVEIVAGVASSVRRDVLHG